MENIVIAAGETTPSLNFDFAQSEFKISGMSYMEDVGEFYNLSIEILKGHLENLQEAKIKFIFDLDYFNSSSARIIFNLFELLDSASEAGNEVAIEWHFDDEDIGEEGEELAEDLESAKFHLIKK